MCVVKIWKMLMDWKQFISNEVFPLLKQIIVIKFAIVIRFVSSLIISHIFQYKYCLGILLFVFPQKAISSVRSHSKIVVKYLSKNEEEKLFDVAHTKCIESIEAENFVHWRSAFKQYNYCLYCNSLNKNHITFVSLTHWFRILFELLSLHYSFKILIHKYSLKTGL